MPGIKKIHYAGLQAVLLYRKNDTIFVQTGFMQLNKEIILQKLRTVKPALQEKYNLTVLALFGS